MVGSGCCRLCRYHDDLRRHHDERVVGSSAYGSSSRATAHHAVVQKTKLPMTAKATAQPGSSADRGQASTRQSGWWATQNWTCTGLTPKWTFAAWSSLCQRPSLSTRGETNVAHRQRGRMPVDNRGKAAERVQRYRVPVDNRLWCQQHTRARRIWRRVATARRRLHPRQLRARLSWTPPDGYSPGAD